MSENFQVNNMFHCLPLFGKSAKTFNAVIEIEKGGKNKYELDKEFGIFKLDRVLYGAVFYPTDYGFFPQTWSIEEEDPLDIMIICTNPTITGCMVEVRMVGVFKMKDRGVFDHKMIAVAVRDPRLAHIKTVLDLGPHFKKEIQDFWENYAKLQPTKKIEVLGWGSAKEAEMKILAAHEVYKKVFRNKIPSL